MFTVHNWVSLPTQASAITLQNKRETERVGFKATRNRDDWHRLYSFMADLLQNLLYVERREVFVQINDREVRARRKTLLQQIIKMLFELQGKLWLCSLGCIRFCSIFMLRQVGLSKVVANRFVRNNVNGAFRVLSLKCWLKLWIEKVRLSHSW